MICQVERYVCKHEGYQLGDTIGPGSITEKGSSDGSSDGEGYWGVEVWSSGGF